MEVNGYPIQPGADLSAANLSGAQLPTANLSKTNLRNAQLDNAILMGADLQGADLTGANLAGANLWGADLTGAICSNANFSDAFLADAICQETIFTHTNFEGAQLGGTNLTNANLDNARLENIRSDGKTTWPMGFSKPRESHRQSSEKKALFAEITAGPLTQFVEREGHARVPALHTELFDNKEFKLGQWVQTQRRKHRSAQLTPKEVARLSDFRGWRWDIRKGLSFDWWLNGPFRQYFAREGHNPKSDHVELFEGEDVNLGAWCAGLRSIHKKGNLSFERIQKAEAAGFTWSTRNRRRTSNDDLELVAALHSFYVDHQHPWALEGSIINGIDIAAEIRRMWSIFRSAPNQPNYTQLQVIDVQSRVMDRWNRLREVAPELPAEIPAPHHLQKAALIADLATTLKTMTTDPREREFQDPDFADQCHEVRKFLTNSHAGHIPPAAKQLLSETWNWSNTTLEDFEAERVRVANSQQQSEAGRRHTIAAKLNQERPDLFSHLSSPRDHDLVHGRINPPGRRSTLESIAGRWGVSREHVRQLEKQLQELLEDPTLEEIALAFNADSPLANITLEELGTALKLLPTSEIALPENSNKATQNQRKIADLSRLIDARFRALGIPNDAVPKSSLDLEAVNWFWLGERPLYADGSSRKQIREDHLRSLYNDAIVHLLHTQRRGTPISADEAMLEPLENLGLTRRTYNALHQAGFETISEVTDATPSTLLAIPNFGITSLEDLDHCLLLRGHRRSY